MVNVSDISNVPIHDGCSNFQNGASIVAPSDDEDMDQSQPDPADETVAPDDEEIEESEDDEVSSSAPEPAPAAPKPGPGRPQAPSKAPKPAGKSPAAPTPRTKKPPAAASGKSAPAAAPTRSKTPPRPVPTARGKSPNGDPARMAVYRQSAQLLKSIADPTRLGIVDMLRAGEMNVTEICDRLGVHTQPAVSHHLALLRHGRIIEPRRAGKNNFYALTPEHGQLLADLVEEITAT
jgi:DNA-binding transcriptional ArsR family regulator